MKTIAFALQKGGTGKTSTAVSVATELAKKHKVVLIDAGLSKLNVVKEIKNNVGLDLASSKAIVDEAPATVAS